MWLRSAAALETDVAALDEEYNRLVDLSAQGEACKYNAKPLDQMASRVTYNSSIFIKGNPKAAYIIKALDLLSK